MKIFREIFDFYAERGPRWRQLAAGNAALLATIERELALIDDKREDQLAVHSGPLGSRPDKFNPTGRYQFRENHPKGFTLGGAVRCRSANIMSYNRATGATTKGNETVFGDAFATYRRNTPWGAGNLTLQLNVRNLTNSYLFGVGRRNADGNALRRIHLNEPRSFRFTTTLEF